MKLYAIVFGSLALCSAALPQDGGLALIPQGWTLINQDVKAKDGTTFVYRLAPLMLPVGVTAEVTLVETKIPTPGLRGNAISALGKPIQIDFQTFGPSRTFQLGTVLENTDRKLVFTASNPQAFQRLLPDVSRMADGWVIGPASNTTSDSKFWKSENSWSSAGGSATGDRTSVNLSGGASGGASGSGNIGGGWSGGGSISGGGTAGGRANGGTSGTSCGSASSSASSSSSSKDSQSNSSSQRNSQSNSDRDSNSQRNESIVYDPGTRQFQVVQDGGLAITRAKLDGDYVYRSDRLGGTLQARAELLDMIFTIEANTFKIRRQGSDAVVAQGTFLLERNQMQLQYEGGRKETYGFFILSEARGFAERIAIGGTVLTRKH